MTAMRFVQMIWPATRAVAAIPAGAVEGHRGIGWVPLDEWTEPSPEATPAATDIAAADAEATTTTRTPRRRGADTPQE